jgi:MscS family membrane protein
MAKDGGLDAEKSRKAADTVGLWRQQDELPFPDHRPVKVSQLEGTLDFPPEGSVMNEKKEIPEGNR